jgi:hypothetical protein
MPNHAERDYLSFSAESRCTPFPDLAKCCSQSYPFFTLDFRSRPMLSLTTCVLASAIFIAPADQAPPRSEKLEPLKPLIGRWIGKMELHEDIPGVGKKGEPVDFTVMYRWSNNGQAILTDVSFIVKDKSMSFTNGMIIWDPGANKIVGTDTYADGGMMRYEVHRDRKALTLKAVGAKADGVKTSATYTFTIVSPTLRSVEATDRKEGNESLPNITGVELKRVKRTKKAKSSE